MVWPKASHLELEAINYHLSPLSHRWLLTKTWDQKGWAFPVCSCPGSGFETRHTQPYSLHSSVAQSGWEAQLWWLSSVVLLRHAYVSPNNQVTQTFACLWTIWKALHAIPYIRCYLLADNVMQFCHFSGCKHCVMHSLFRQHIGLQFLLNRLNSFD